MPIIQPGRVVHATLINTWETEAEDCGEFKASLSHTVNSRAAWVSG